MRIGVIVPVGPGAPYLDEALASARGQDAPAEREAVVHDEAGAGPAATRDAGLERLGDCDWIALLDADDAWEPGKLAVQRAVIERHPEAVVCFGRARVVDGHGALTGERMPEPAPGVHSGSALVRWLYDDNPIPTSSVLVRRDALVDAGGFAGPAPLASDWDLWLRLAARGPFVCEPHARVRYRRHAGGVTADVAALAESRLAVHAAHRGLVEDDRARRAESRDLVLLARGLIRRRRYADAGEALRRAAQLGPLEPRERALRALVRLPGARSALGRRAPYS